MFEFDAEYKYFSRNTTKSDVVNICDENYNILETIPLEKFNETLQELYNLNLYKSTFRDLIGRYFRIYGKDNYDETNPLHGHKKENYKSAILSIEKLFEVYQIIEEYKKNFDEVSDKLKALNSTRRFDLLPYGKITTKTQYKQNEKSIAQLQKDLENLSQNQTDEYFEQIEKKQKKVD